MDDTNDEVKEEGAVEMETEATPELPEETTDEATA